MIARKSLLTLLIIMAVLLSGCTQKNNETAAQKGSSITTVVPTSEQANQDDNESEEEKVVKNYKELILGVVDIDEDVAEGTAYELAGLGLGEMVTAELVESNDKAYLLCLTDINGEEYYIATDARGYLGIVRKRSRKGIIIHGHVD